VPRSSLATFTALWRAYGEGRLERSLHLVDAQCEIVLLDGRTTYHGHDGVRRWLAEVRRDWRTLTVTYDQVHEPAPDCVVAVGRVRGTSNDGEHTIDLPLACVAEFRDGRLVRGCAFRAADDALRYARERHERATR
jgi:ketosteroid isomerase-like protein